jgi:4-amino-4-deoxy-L-arabinose transferase-like glycosyltransferase
VVAGVATLMRPSWLLFTPLALGVGLAAGPQRARHLRLGVFLLAGLVAAMLPWWLRNWCVAGRFVPTTLQVGESLYDGWNPQATGGSDMKVVDEFRQRLRAEDAARGGAPESGDCFEFRLDRQLRDAALAWARAHPGRVVELAAIKFLRIWNIWPNEPSLRSPWLRAAVMGGYTPVLVFGLLGVWRFARRGWPYVLCFLPAAYFTALHVIFVGSLRYRQPALLPLIVLAAGATVELVFGGRTGRDDAAHG